MRAPVHLPSASSNKQPPTLGGSPGQLHRRHSMHNTLPQWIWRPSPLLDVRYWGNSDGTPSSEPQIALSHRQKNRSIQYRILGHGTSSHPAVVTVGASAREGIVRERGSDIELQNYPFVFFAPRRPSTSLLMLFLPRAYSMTSLSTAHPAHCTDVPGTTNYPSDGRLTIPNGTEVSPYPCSFACRDWANMAVVPIMSLLKRTERSPCSSRSTPGTSSTSPRTSRPEPRKPTLVGAPSMFAGLSAAPGEIRNRRNTSSPAYLISRALWPISTPSSIRTTAQTI